MCLNKINLNNTFYIIFHKENIKLKKNVIILGMILTDTHCHIHSLDYPLDINQVFKNCQKANVKRLVCIGTDLEDSLQAINFVKEHSNNQYKIELYATVGLHPHEAEPTKMASYDDAFWAKFEDLAGQKEVIGIGECGYDLFYHQKEDLKLQEQIFNKQLSIAAKLNKPVVLHIRESFEHLPASLALHPSLKLIIHSFSGTIADINIVKKLPNLAYFSVNGIMTFSKNEDQQKALDVLSVQELLIETDSPYLSPTGFRGQPNQPSYITSIFDLLAKKHHLSNQNLADILELNYQNIFGKK
jgi:TatD DNase family protein